MVSHLTILRLRLVAGKMNNLPFSKPMPASNATNRFSDRVENYVRYRPGYPLEVLQELKAECGLAASPTSAIPELEQHHFTRRAPL